MLMSPEERSRRVLSDHQRVGSRFIPPFVHKLGALGEVRWLDGPLPEAVWLALLNDQYGLRRGAHLGVSVAKAASAVVEPERPWFAPASAFAALSPDQWTRVVESLRLSGELGELQDGLRPLVGLYPACPLAPLLGGGVPKGAADPAYLPRLKRLLAGLFDRTTKAATLMQANAIYIAFVTDLLKVAPQTSLANFPAVAEYPDTEEARRIGAAVGASINGFFGHHYPEPSTWSRYFWNRGLEIDACTFGASSSDEEGDEQRVGGA
jgi:hypothetical protein